MEFTFSLVNFEYYLLILTRIASFMFVAPIFGQEGVPNLSKIGISGTLAIMVLYTVEPVEAAYSSVIGYGILVLKEASVGLLIGFAAYVCNAIILFAGNVIDMDIGISMAQEFDPTLRTQVSVTGSMYNYFMLIFLFVTGMYQYLIRAVADSFVLIPLGGANYHTDMLLTVFVTFMTNVFAIGFRIFLPIFATILIMNVILGIMAKVAQQLNMFSVGIQLKILAGLTVLYLTIYLFPEVCGYIFDQMSVMIRNTVEGLR